MNHLGELFFSAILLATLLSAIPLMVSMVVGLVVSVLQAATQVQEQTLTFVPKLVAVGAALVLFGPWMLAKMEECFTLNLTAVLALAGEL